MENLIALVVYGPMIIIGFLVSLMFFTRIVKPVPPNKTTRAYRVTVDEIHDDGNILVSDNRMFSGGVMVSHPDWRSVRLGQRILIKKEGMEWKVA